MIARAIVLSWLLLGYGWLMWHGLWLYATPLLPLMGYVAYGEWDYGEDG